MQTYDRRFIVEWFSAGNQMCPQTQQVILNTTLIPNILIRSMIAQWCTENGFALPPRAATLFVPKQTVSTSTSKLRFFCIDEFLQGSQT